MTGCFHGTCHIAEWLSTPMYVRIYFQDVLLMALTRWTCTHVNLHVLLINLTQWAYTRLYVCRYKGRFTCSTLIYAHVCTRVYPHVYPTCLYACLSTCLSTCLYCCAYLSGWRPCHAQRPLPSLFIHVSVCMTIPHVVTHVYTALRY